MVKCCTWLNLKAILLFWNSYEQMRGDLLMLRKRIEHLTGRDPLASMYAASTKTGESNLNIQNNSDTGRSGK